MIPILFDATETSFNNNGLGRLRDAISVIVTEERNGIYECSFEYPLDGINYDLIQVGRIIGVTHDESGDIEPFDIVSYSKPINGVVTFHCTHISYRLSYMTVTGSSINSLSDAFTLFESAQPSMPFQFQTDKASTGYLACADGTPRSVRQMMGGIEGSILDAYGGEYSYNNWTVSLNESRGQLRDFQIRYGVNMLEYNEDFDTQGTYMSCIPYWSNGEVTVVGDKVNGTESTITGRDECVPLDLSDKFEDEPTKAQVEAAAVQYMNLNSTYLPGQTIHVEFVRLQDFDESFQNLLLCNLCDTIKVIFPDYGTSGQFKIVKTVWDVLTGRYTEMELGTLSTSLSEALGISNGLNSSSSGGGGGGSSLIGEIKAFAGSSAPSGWLLCQGQAVSRTTYASLFAIIGTTYGAGDGTTTFNLPNAEGRTLIGASSGHALGTSGGSETVTLDTTMIPAHTHGSRTVSYDFTSRRQGAGYQSIWAGGNVTVTQGTGRATSNGAGTANQYVDAVALSASHTHDSVGGGQAHNNMQPFVVINYIIYAGV